MFFSITGVLDFNCEECGKAFARKENLKKHMKVHEGGKTRPGDYICEDCGKGFDKKEYLIKHMIVHEGKKEYKCEYCDKSFSIADNLMKHINTVHLDKFEQTQRKTAFSCTQCEFECIQMDQLKDHINSIHGQSKKEETKPNSGAGILQDTLEMWYI